MKQLSKNIHILMGIVLFLCFFGFYSRIVPIIPFDTDDWYYMGYYRIPLPIWGDWNPSRVLPEILMPNLSILAAHVIYPVTGNYIASMTMIYAIFMALLLVILCYQLYRYAESLGTPKLPMMLLTLFWVLLHFTLLAGAASGNTWLWGSITATCYFYYAIPAIWNEALVIYLIRKRDVKKSVLVKILLCVFCYFGVFSNLFPAVILPAYTVMDLLVSFVRWIRDTKEGRGSFAKFLKEELFNLYVIILFLISVVFELSGGRASGFSGFQFAEVMETLKKSVSTVNPWALISIVLLLLYSTISLVRHRDSDALKSEQRFTLSKLLGAFAMVLLFNVLVCARTGAWYIGRQDVLVDIVFFVLLAVFTLVSYAFTGSENKKSSYLVLGVALLLNVLAFVRFNPSFYAPTNSGGLSAEQCVQIDEDIVHQITEAVSENQSRMDLKVPDFGSSDNWPLATYAGGPYSRFAYTLWRHGLIQKSISINVVPDQAKNAEFGF